MHFYNVHIDAIDLLHTAVLQDLVSLCSKIDEDFY